MEETYEELMRGRLMARKPMMMGLMWMRPGLYGLEASKLTSDV